MRENLPPSLDILPAREEVASTAPGGISSRLRSQNLSRSILL